MQISNYSPVKCFYRKFKKMENKNNIAVVNAVKPVLPPAEIPAPDSTKVVTVEAPIKAPATVATESATMILS